jgi:hypothetical protein
VPPSADARGLVRFRSSPQSCSSQDGPLHADEGFERPDLVSKDPDAYMEVDEGDGEEARTSRRRHNSY